MRFSTFITLLLTLLCLFSCTTDEWSHEEVDEIKYIDVSIGLSPAIEQSEEPLSRYIDLSAGLYTVNILWRGKSLNSYTPYAAGLFDDISNIKIRLIEGYEYRGDCSYISYDQVGYPVDYDKDGAGLYGKPFAIGVNQDSLARITNKLLVSMSPYYEKSPFYYGAYSGTVVYTINSSGIKHPSINRYFGKGYVNLQNIAPSNVNINVELKRAYYDLEFSTENLPVGDRVRVKVDGVPSEFIMTGDDSGNEQITTQRTRMSMNNIASIWTGDINSSESITLTNVEYYSAEKDSWGSLYNSSISINVHRNKINKVKFTNISDPNTDIDIELGEGDFGGTPSGGELSQEIDFGKY